MPVADLGDVQIAYEIHGDGPPVLGIMGFGLDQQYWATQVPAVTATHSFITFDNRGIGRSRGPLAATVDELADDAARLLDHLGVDEAVVLGMSLGGAIAQRLVLDHPDRASALVLGITWARPIEFMRRQHDLARVLLEHGYDAFIDGSLIRMFTPRFFEAGRFVIDGLVQIFRGQGPPPDARVLMAQLDAVDKHDTLADLGRITCPTLVFGGKMDMMVPGFASEEIAAAIPGARLVMFETGHGLVVEEMDTVNRLIMEFLASL